MCTKTTDDIRCPYCGQVMTLSPWDPWSDEGDPGQCYCYECPDCASISPTRETIAQTIEAARERANPPAQPLTLAELMDLPRPWQLWVERPGYTLTPMILYTSYCGDRGGKVFCLNNLLFDAASYNRKWRCWLTKPTDVERDAAHWEVNSDER